MVEHWSFQIASLKKLLEQAHIANEALHGHRNQPLSVVAEMVKFMKKIYHTLQQAAGRQRSVDVRMLQYPAANNNFKLISICEGTKKIQWLASAILMLVRVHRV